MTFDDETLYGRDDDMDEFGDTGGYGENLEEEDFDEEEEDRPEDPGDQELRHAREYRTANVQAVLRRRRIADLHFWKCGS